MRCVDRGPQHLGVAKVEVQHALLGDMFGPIARKRPGWVECWIPAVGEYQSPARRFHFKRAVSVRFRGQREPFDDPRKREDTLRPPFSGAAPPLSQNIVFMGEREFLVARPALPSTFRGQVDGIGD